MGGRAAEEVFLVHLTPSTAYDIERATDIARKMVCEWGMSDLMGPLTFGQKEEQIFLGKEFARHRDYSEQTATNVDGEIRTIVTDKYEEARKIIEEGKEAVIRIAEALLERESLDAKEIEALIEGRPLPDIEEPPEPEEEEQVDLSPEDEGAEVVLGRAPDPGKA